MSILITGAGGFVGTHLSRHLLATTPGADIFGPALDLPADRLPGVHYQAVDLLDAPAVQEMVTQIQPTQVYHLAAQASPSLSLKKGWAWKTLENNIRAQLNIIEACLSLDRKPRILIVSSGEIYAGFLQADELPVRESAPLRPANPYSVSKVTQDMMGLQYFLSHQMPIVRARPFNHSGPGQSAGFVAPDFAMQVARIEAGQQEPVLRVGNLSGRRDFTDVRDVVRAYSLLMEQGIAGEAYNVASGQAYSAEQILNSLLGYTEPGVRERIRIEYDAELWRPLSVPVILGDATKLREATGWQPQIPFEQTLLDLLEDCRQRIRVSAQQ